ncbi:MAG: hypothetical protein A2754_00815 [Candidatus Magasanikbacteria bacterium RIFCSPHIGHO2_01_FULL_47_8]|uniref:Uncharacterized protein n=1 Tax=Candidatus Magasanikbacteria bacterium RIFCSPHIGHO2_01_FULL_47_8 TaxID=1798673 RepID=A0A1F6MCW8_9BACT|nr:MAG: hypothetical protein A2754_00815 [Candidatus Magasanikbacteria bacterium RIFCSPHIGHO2_01_FULL_47_8]
MLSAKAQQTIQNYLNLPFPGLANVRCPYFNNAKLGQRGQLRVLIGKGTPQEIVEEAQIVSIQYRAGLFDKTGSCCLHNEHTGEPISAEDIRRFLIDHNIGIECSGFVTQVLRQEYLATKGFDFTKKIYITSPTKIFRWLIAKLRPVENISVKTYADNKNTKKILDSTKHNYNDIEPGDLIVMLDTGPNNKRNHIALVTSKNDRTINYVHARAWSSEGKYDHGVTAGKIVITAPEKNLLEQEWIEKDRAGETNETYLEAKQAKVLEIRRIKL